MGTIIKVSFIHPTDGRTMTVTLDSMLTVQEVINELISNKFINQSLQGYELAIKGGQFLKETQTLDGAVIDGEILRVIPAIRAGLLF
jgi:hypothetical protein